MSEITIMIATLLVLLYGFIDQIMVTSRYFTPIYIAVSALLVVLVL